MGRGVISGKALSFGIPSNRSEYFSMPNVQFIHKRGWLFSREAATFCIFEVKSSSMVSGFLVPRSLPDRAVVARAAISKIYFYSSTKQ